MDRASSTPPVIDAASVALWRAARAREVLLAKRGSTNLDGRPMSFGGAWVFPGGKVDPADHDDPRPFARAAVREVEEEVGVTVPTDHVRYLWTLASESRGGRRYLTRFTAAPLPHDAMPGVDGAELVDLRWMTPGDAVRAADEDRMVVPPATLTTLRRLDADWNRPTGAGLRRVRRGRPCRLSDLADVDGVDLRGTDVDRDLVVTDVVHRDDEVVPGVLFASRRSRNPDDERAAEAVRKDRIGNAITRGAVAVLLDDERDARTAPRIVVRDVATALGPIASAVHSHPSDSLIVVFVTGTDGKTTTCYFTAAALGTGFGFGTGLLTTVERRIGGTTYASMLTTGEAPDLQRDLARMVGAGDRAAVVETSSIALAQHRLGAVAGDVAVFTNLSLEHLDHHGTMEGYYDAKAALFQPVYVRHAVVAIDDVWGRRVASLVRAERQLGLTTVSTTSDGADAVVVERARSGAGTEARVRVHGTELDIEVRLPGDHNLANALAAVAAGVAAGADPRRAAAGIGLVEGVPGRMDRIANDRGIVALVDYAHTPNALAAVLAACRQLTQEGRVIVVAGCGGDRDHAKRDAMGIIAYEQADLFVATSDNPRREDPEDILDQLIGDLPPNPARLRRITDREEAIRWAVGRAEPGDVVIVAGKGHEQYQEVEGVKHPFDDHVIVADALGTTWTGRR